MPSRGKFWMDNIKEWAALPMLELLMIASRRKDWKRISVESSFLYAPKDSVCQGTELKLNLTFPSNMLQVNSISL